MKDGSQSGPEYDDPTAKYVNTLFRNALKKCKKNHTAWTEADKFVTGYQWSEADTAKLNSEDRPVAVFNFVKRHINIVCGVEILNRLSPSFLPRVTDQEKFQILAELATGAHDFVMEACDGYFEISEAFKDLVIRGAGFMKERLDLITEPGGKIIWERVDGRHLVWDGDATKQNLEDSRYWIYFAKVPKEEAANEWPHEAAYIKSGQPSDYDDAFGTSAKDQQVVPPVYDPINKYETDQIDSSDKHHVIVKEAYWYEDEKFFEYVDPFEPDKGIKQMPAKEFRAFKKEYENTFPERPEIEGSECQKRIYKRAFVIGRRTMEESDAPCQKGFPIKAMTADWDEKEKTFIGLPHVLKDPQQFLNKYLSQTMHSIATSPKGVLLFEDGTFENLPMAEEQWASWAPFIPMTKGSIAAKSYEYIAPVQPPQILFEMWKGCIDVISQISGISQEMLMGGIGEVPGITMRQRQGVAMISMAGYFNSYRRFLKSEAVITLEQVQKFYTDERIIRIGGPYDGKGVSLAEWRDELAYPYDLVIDENPHNPNTQEQNWQKLVDSGILPGLFKSGAIMQVPSFIDSFPITPKQKAEMKQWIMKAAASQEQGQGPGQKPAAKGKQDPPEKIAADVEHRKAQTQQTLSKAKALDAEAENKKLQGILDIFAQSYEMQNARREHQLTALSTTHGMQLDAKRHKVEQFNALLGGLTGLASANNKPQAGIQ